MRTARAAGSGDRHRVVEEDHDAVAGEALERALVRRGSARPSPRGTRAARPSPPPGSAVSVKAVKPRRSRKTTVISRRWLFSGSSAPPATMSSASCGEKKRFSRRQPLELRHLSAHALLERAVPLRQLVALALAPRRSSALMRSSDLTRASSSAWLTGLVRKSSAPASSPLTRSCAGSSAVHHHDRQHAVRRVGADRAADLVAAHARHHHVEQHQVGLLGVDARQRLGARRRR